MILEWMKTCARAVPLARTATVAAALPLLLSGLAQAQLPIPASSQFDITGFVQEATLGGAGTGAGAGALQGGTIKVNGHVIIVPSGTVVILPASAFTWQELFALAPLPYGPAQTGLAAADLPAPLGTYEAHVVGNRVGDRYIAGLVHISQSTLNSGAGFINYMDYALGEMRVGGVLGDPTTGARVRLNDPVGRFGRATPVPEPRFSVDDANPTIAAGTGFPMCFPRTDPKVADDPLCPQGNRPILTPGPIPVYQTSIQTNDPTALPGIFPDATKQAPFEVGDYVTFSGTLVQDGSTATAGPWPLTGTGSTYVAAHTISSNVAVFTWPGTNPAYVSIEVSLLGTGGLTVLGAGEAVIRTRFEGMTTDPTRNIHLYGVDFDPLTGATTDRDFGTIGVDPGAPTGAVKGRWRFRPPCLAAGSIPTKPDKECVMNASGTFLPPPREVRAVIEGLQTQVPGTAGAVTSANGLFYGQYHAPIDELIFPENIPGTPIVENNFNTIPFLAQGGYPSSTGVLGTVLDPWPSNVLPAAACTPAVAGAGGPYTVASGGTVTLAATASGTTPVSFSWAVPATGTLSSTTVNNPTFTAPLVAAQTVVPLSVTASNACGSSTATTNVTVNAAAAPTVAHLAPLSVFSGASGSFVVSGTDPGGLQLTFAVTQSGTPALTSLTVGAASCSAGTCTATVSYSAPSLPIGQTTSVVITLTTVATNAASVSSAADVSSITVNPLPDAVLITSTEYRTSKQRLIVNATSSVVSPNVILTLQPYVTTAGTTFDPTLLGAVFTNNGGGLYILTLVGAPEPAIPPAVPLVVKSNLGGTSPPHGLDKIRQ